MLEQQFFSTQIPLLQKSIEEQFGVSVSMGAELEFYLRADSSELAKEHLGELAPKCLRLEKERGEEQHEAVFCYKSALSELIKQIHDMKKAAAAKKGCRAIFDAKPFPYDYGSALHLNLSLHDNTGRNVFAATNIDEREIIGKVLAGLIDISAESVYLLCTNAEDYLRFTPKFLSPTHISWGANNRTTMLRIPDSAPKNRRIEFRLPPASASPEAAVYIMLIGVLHGLSNELLLPARVYGNAFDLQYNLPVIANSLEEAKNAFEKGRKILHYSGKSGKYNFSS